MPARQGLHHSVGSSKDTFQLAWPVIGNFNVYRGERRTVNYHWWIDDTKAPLRRT